MCMQITPNNLTNRFWSKLALPKISLKNFPTTLSHSANQKTNQWTGVNLPEGNESQLCWWHTVNKTCTRNSRTTNMADQSDLSIFWHACNLLVREKAAFYLVQDFSGICRHTSNKKLCKKPHQTYKFLLQVNVYKILVQVSWLCVSSALGQADWQWIVNCFCDNNNNDNKQNCMQDSCDCQKGWSFLWQLLWLIPINRFIYYTYAKHNIRKYNCFLSNMQHSPVSVNEPAENKKE